MDDQTKRIFILSELVKLYILRLDQPTGEIQRRVNAASLKYKIIYNISNIEIHKSNYKVVLSSKDNITTMRESDNSALVLTRAVEIVLQCVIKKNVSSNVPVRRPSQSTDCIYVNDSH
jgi:hypothetical protein